MTEELNQTFSELFEKGTNKYLRENKKIRILINTTTESLNFKNIYSIGKGPKGLSLYRPFLLNSELRPLLAIEVQIFLF